MVRFEKDNLITIYLVYVRNPIKTRNIDKHIYLTIEIRIYNFEEKENHVVYNKL